MPNIRMDLGFKKRLVFLYCLFESIENIFYKETCVFIKLICLLRNLDVPRILLRTNLLF